MHLRAIALMGAQFTLALGRLGIDLWGEPPRLRGKRIIVNKEATIPQGRQAEPDAEHLARSAGEPPDLLQSFHFFIEPTAANEHPTPLRITINRRTGRIEWNLTTREPFRMEPLGEGALFPGLAGMALTWSAALPLVAMHRYYRHIEKRTSLSRHAQTFLDAIKGQVDDEVYADLTLAFQKDWAYTNRKDPDPTFAEAKALLSQFAQTLSTALSYSDGDFMPVRVYAWHERNAQGPRIAEARQDPDGAIYVTVNRSIFSGNEALELVDHHTCRTHLETVTPFRSGT